MFSFRAATVNKYEGHTESHEKIDFTIKQRYEEVNTTSVKSMQC